MGAFQVYVGLSVIDARESILGYICDEWFLETLGR